MSKEKSVMTVKELADTMGISLVSAYQLCRIHGFPVVRVGRAIRIPIDRFHEWLASQQN